MSNINKQPHKVEGTTVFYWNGEKWLVREYCESKKEAQELLESINNG